MTYSGINPCQSERSTEDEGSEEKILFKKWQCVVCDFIYDEAVGLPEDDIAPGTRWEDIPDTWTCRDCGAPKSDFRMVEIEA